MTVVFTLLSEQTKLVVQMHGPLGCRPVICSLTNSVTPTVQLEVPSQDLNVSCMLMQLQVSAWNQPG